MTPGLHIETTFQIYLGNITKGVPKGDP